MAFYDKFPYTNFQELNLDWLTQEVSKVRDNRDASDASAAAALASEKAAKASETAAAASQQAAANSETAAAGSEAASADYLAQIGTHTAGAVADWLKENLTPTTPPIDATLTVSGAAADAKKTGDAVRDLKSALKDGNVADLLTLHAGSTVTSYKVKFTVNDDESVTASGTATGDALFDLYNSQTGFIGDVVPGDELYFDFSGTNVMGIVAVWEGTSVRDIVESMTSVRFRIPLSATGMIVRLGVANGVTVNETVNISIYHGYTNKGLKENMAFLESTVKDVKTNVWHKGLLTAAGVINTDSRGIYSDIISGCNSIWVNFDHIAYVFLYRSGYYIGKIAADGSLNRVAGDWKAFSGGVDVGALLTQYKADSARITVTPQNSATITEANANDYGNVNCDLAADIYIRGANGLEDAVRDSAYLPYILGNPLYKYFKAFNWCGVDTSGTEITYGSGTYARCTAICRFNEPVYVAINHHDYQLGIYWNDTDGKHYKTWSEGWEVPAGVPVAIVIRRAEWSSNPESMAGETPWIYLFVRSLNDKPKDYFNAEIEDTIQKIKAVNTEPSLCFTLSTDHHYMTVINWLSKYDSISDMYANMREVGKAINFDFNVSLGDVADFKAPYSDAVANRFGISDRTPAGLNSLFYHWMEYVTKRLYNINPHMIYVAGNHDDNRYLRVDGATSGYDYTPGEMYSYYYANAFKTLAGSNPDNPLEYYFDVDTLGIRVIILDSNYYTEGTGWGYGFSDSTAAWLGTVLSASMDKQVLIMSHMSPIASHNGDNTDYPNFSAVANAIQTFKTDGGTLIALLYGHSHCDWTTDTPWRDIALNCQKCHQNTASYPNMPGCVAPARTCGTATEDSWNVVVIKPKSRTINIIRFGAGDDQAYTY